MDDCSGTPYPNFLHRWVRSRLGQSPVSFLNLLDQGKQQDLPSGVYLTRGQLHVKRVHARRELSSNTPSRMSSFSARPCDRMQYEYLEGERLECKYIRKGTWMMEDGLSARR